MGYAPPQTHVGRRRRRRNGGFARRTRCAACRWAMGRDSVDRLGALSGLGRRLGGCDVGPRPIPESRYDIPTTGPIGTSGSVRERADRGNAKTLDGQSILSMYPLLSLAVVAVRLR